MKTWIIIAVLALVLSSIAMTAVFGFATTYKPEIWAALLLALYGLTKKRNIVVNVPKDSVKIETHGKPIFTNEDIVQVGNEDVNIDVDKSNVKAWKDVKVGEMSLEGEDYKSEE